MELNRCQFSEILVGQIGQQRRRRRIRMKLFRFGIRWIEMEEQRFNVVVRTANNKRQMRPG